MICRISEIWDTLENADDSDDFYPPGDPRECVERIFLDSKRLLEIRSMRIEWEEGHSPEAPDRMETHRKTVADAADVRSADAERLDILKWHGVENSWLEVDQKKKKEERRRRRASDPLCSHVILVKGVPDHTCTNFAGDSTDMCSHHDRARTKRLKKVEESPGLCYVSVGRSEVCKKLVVQGGRTCSSHTQERADESVKFALEILKRSSEIDKWYLKNRE